MPPSGSRGCSARWAYYRVVPGALLTLGDALRASDTAAAPLG
jgi:hypothetical protein